VSDYAYIGRGRNGTARSGVTQNRPAAPAAACFLARWRELTVYRIPDAASPVAAIERDLDTAKRTWWAES
jgi:hypothetical protein